MGHHKNIGRVVVFVILAWLGHGNALATSTAKSLEKSLRKAASTMAPNLQGRVCVMDLTEAGDPAYTSEFGQLVTERFSNQLVGQGKGGFSVVARRELIGIIRDAMIFGDDNATMKRLQKEAQMDIMVTGNYGQAGDDILVNLKAVSAVSGQVVASFGFTIKNTNGLEEMLIHRFRLFPEGKDDADKGGDVLELEVGVFYQGGDGKLYPVREGMVLTSKDNYSVYVRARSECHIYVYQVDSSQKAVKLFPNPDFNRWNNPVRAGEEMWIPEKDFFYLDENIGNEEIYLFATHAPSPSLDAIREASLNEIQSSIKTMGVAGRRGSEVIRKVSGIRGNGIELIQRKLASRGDFFYKIAFIHR